MSDRQRFAGIVAVVTGASAGIGAAAARAFAREGANVVVAARGAEPLRKIVDEIEAAGGRALAVATDVAVQAQCEALLRTAADAFGGVDVLVNNAAVYGGYDPDDPATIDAADRLLTLNLLRPIALTTALLPQMRRLPEAMVVNVTSGLAIAPNDHSVYCASKSGLRAYSMSLRHHLRSTGVHVLEALPPNVATRMNTSTGNRMAPEECARQILRAMVCGADEANIGMVKVLRAIYSVSPALARRVMRDS